MRTGKTDWRHQQENFVDHPYLQSTLREMHAVLQSRRLWLTFLAVLAIFIVTGPFGTSETMSFADRLLYWTIIQASAWIFAISFSIIAKTILSGHIDNMLARMMIGSLTAALPIGLLLTITNQIFYGKEMGLTPALKSSLSSLPLCAIFCLLSYLTTCQSFEKAAEAETGTDANADREVTGIILIPVAAKKIGYLEAASIPGIAAMDVCIPIVSRSCRSDTVIYSFAIGVIMCMVTSVGVPLFMGV